MSERPTPETDGLVPQFLNGGEVPDVFAHCRKLERERDEAREDARLLAYRLTELELQTTEELARLEQELNKLKEKYGREG